MQIKAYEFCDTFFCYKEYRITDFKMAHLEFDDLCMHGNTQRY